MNVHIFLKMRNTLCAIWDEWKENNNPKAFAAHAKRAETHLAKVAPQATFLKLKKRPFCLIYKLNGHEYKLRVTDRMYSIRRLR